MVDQAHCATDTMITNIDTKPVTTADRRPCMCSSLKSGNQKKVRRETNPNHFNQTSQRNPNPNRTTTTITHLYPTKPFPEP